MNSLLIRRSSLRGHLHVPPSKSHTLRALIFSMLAKGTSWIHNYLISPDTDAMIRSIEQLGAKVEKRGTSLRIEGTFGKISLPKDILDAGNSGIVLRFIPPIAAVREGYFVITGDASIKTSRPITPLVEGLEDLGAICHPLGDGARAPLVIKGPIRAGKIKINGADSQPVSAFLIACTLLDAPTEISVACPGETPWIDMTLSYLKAHGANVEREGYERYVVYPRGGYENFEVTIPGDYSSASFPLAAAFITRSELIIEGLSEDDLQGDRKLFEIVRSMGGFIERLDPQRVYVDGRGELLGREVDINDCIDALPVLTALCCFARGVSKIYNGAIARKKESDRIAAIAKELNTMGAQIEEKEDGVIITPSKLYGAKVFSHKDHRIAMSLAVAAMGAQGNTCIQDTECIQKTYMSFFDDFAKIGCNIEML